MEDLKGANRMHSINITRELFAAAVLVVVTTLTSHSSAMAQCDPTVECCATACSSPTQLPSSQACIADACACAQQLNCYIGEREASWSLYLNSPEFELTTLPVHGRYLTTRANPTATQALAAFAPGTPGPVELPDGSIIVKNNFPPDPIQPGIPNTDPDATAVTSMIKLQGYCPEFAGATDQCVGGDWFFSLRIADLFPLFGKPSSCVVCHAPASKSGDWLWKLNSARRYQPQ